MTDDKVLAAVTDAETRIIGRGIKFKPWAANPSVKVGCDYEHHFVILGHLLYMCESIRGFIAAGRREKAMRWLGFLQGALWVRGLATIDDMKEANRPDEQD